MCRKSQTISGPSMVHDMQCSLSAAAGSSELGFILTEAGCRVARLVHVDKAPSLQWIF